jgi:methionyl-tRNA formyltransferase
MKIVFMGTPKFAVPSLKILADNNYEIPFVVTVPDREKGRGLKKQFSDVKIFATERNLPVLQPAKLKDPEFLDALSSVNPDLIVIIAFRMLPKEVYAFPRLGSMNVHASYLPKYRGAAPINRAIINGEKETGLTTFFLEDKADTGNILLQQKVEIGEYDDAGMLHDKLSVLGAELLLKSIKLIESGNYELKAQDDSLATSAPKIFKNDCVIDWAKPSDVIHNLVRGLSPYPAAFTTLNGKVFKIFKTCNTVLKSVSEPGNILVENKKIFVNTGSSLIELLEIQLEGKKRIPSGEFLNGIDKKNLIKFN